MCTVRNWLLLIGIYLLLLHFTRVAIEKFPMDPDLVVSFVVALVTLGSITLLVSLTHLFPDLWKSLCVMLIILVALFIAGCTVSWFRVQLFRKHINSQCRSLPILARKRSG